MIEWIAKDLDVTTLRYQKIEEMVEAIGLSKDKLCLYCWNGEAPSKGCSKENKQACQSCNVS